MLVTCSWCSHGYIPLVTYFHPADGLKAEGAGWSLQTCLTVCPFLHYVQLYFILLQYLSWISECTGCSGPVTVPTLVTEKGIYLYMLATAAAKWFFFLFSPAGKYSWVFFLSPGRTELLPAHLGSVKGEKKQGCTKAFWKKNCVCLQICCVFVKKLFWTLMFLYTVFLMCSY